VSGALKQSAYQSEKRRVAKKGDGKQQTAQGVMDESTRHMLFRWVNDGIMTAVHGILSTGKEANVYHGTAGHRAEEHDGWACEEFALKVFRTTLNEFQNRPQCVNTNPAAL